MPYLSALDRVAFVSGYYHAIPVCLQQFLNTVAGFRNILHYQDGHVTNHKALSCALRLAHMNQRPKPAQPPLSSSCLSTFGQTDKFDPFCESQKLHDANAPPVEIDLVPGEPMARRGRVRMMIIVPAFAKGQQRDPPVVP